MVFMNFIILLEEVLWVVEEWIFLWDWVEYGDFGTPCLFLDAPLVGDDEYISKKYEHIIIQICVMAVASKNLNRQFKSIRWRETTTKSYRHI